MKRILVAAYYFPPCNIIAAQRAQSFADNFKKYGLHPVVVTRHWNGDENSDAGYESENLAPPSVTENENYTLIRLPYAAQLDQFYHRSLLKFRAGKSSLYAALYSAGRVNPKNNAFRCFHDYLIGYLSENPVEYILATGFPMNAIKLGHSLAQKFDKPFIADFRDLWDNRLLAEGYQPSPAARMQNFFYEFYLKKWLARARLITSVSQPLIDEIKRIAPPQAKTLVVTNGFEKNLFDSARHKIAPPTEKFVFSVIGTLHPTQNLSVMLDGLKLFLAGKNLREIELNFIGTTAFERVEKAVRNNLPPECLKITDRVPRREAIERMLASHVLFHAGWRGYQGIASGKIYEYLGAGRNVLIAPNDRDVMEKIINETNAGKLADDAEEFARIMNDWFSEWKQSGKIEYQGVWEKVENYTREKQAEKLARKILSLE